MGDNYKMDQYFYADAYETIERLGLWEFFRTETPPEGKGYMFWSHPTMDRLTKEMKTANDHSGASWGLTMRTMEYIAKNGWEQWVAKIK